ncbi:MAG: protein O-mannosyl-transferase family, partial [Phycisphaerae bacterium]
MKAASRKKYRQKSRRHSTKALWLTVFLSASVLYLLTAQHGVAWQDSAIRQERVMRLDILGDMGLALAHPLYILVGAGFCRLIPGVGCPTLLNMLSGLAMAVALANIASLVGRLTHRHFVGLSVAAMLAVTHTIWWLSAITEVYTLYLAAFTAELFFLVVLIERRTLPPLLAMMFINGLGLAVHNFALLPLPVYAAVAVVLFIRKQISLGELALGGLAWLVGAGLYIGLTIYEIATLGSVVEGLRSALVGGYGKQVASFSLVSRFTKANLVLMALNFVSLLLPLALIGWWTLRKRHGGLLAGAVYALTIIEVLFVVRYPVPDQFMFILPSMVMIGIA